MPVTRTYECPSCEHRFNFLHLNTEEPAPDYCPKCGEYFGDEPRTIPAGFMIATNRGKAADRHYRELEKASEVRAEAAGNPNLKITNMRDSLKAGEVAAQPVNNVVTQFAEQTGHQYWQGGGSTAVGPEVAQAIELAKMGGERGTGAVGLKALQSGRHAPPQATPGVKGRWGR